MKTKHELPPEAVSPDSKHLLERHFYSQLNERLNLNIDYVNAYSAQLSVVTGGKEYYNILEPIPTYQEYFKTHYPDHFDSVMDGSDPEVIAEVNNLVVAFNDDLERTKGGGDVSADRELLERIDILVRSVKEGVRPSATAAEKGV